MIQVACSKSPFVLDQHRVLPGASCKPAQLVACKCSKALTDKNRGGQRQDYLVSNTRYQSSRCFSNGSLLTTQHEIRKRNSIHQIIYEISTYTYYINRADQVNLRHSSPFILSQSPYRSRRPAYLLRAVHILISLPSSKWTSPMIKSAHAARPAPEGFNTSQNLSEIRFDHHSSSRVYHLGRCRRGFLQGKRQQYVECVNRSIFNPSNLEGSRDESKYTTSGLDLMMTTRIDNETFSDVQVVENMVLHNIALRRPASTDMLAL